MRNWLMAIAVAAGLAGCRTVRPRQPDKPVPGPNKTVVVSFEPLFEGALSSNSVYPAHEPGLMRRILLSPNLVLESSRSSVDEPQVWGPAPSADSPRAPGLKDALGKAVDMELSSMLLAYLSAKPRSSVLLAPAMTKKWDPRFWCIGTKDCVEATWVERLLLMQQKMPARSKDADLLPPEGNPSELPTCALAVRELGLSVQEVAVVSELNPGTGQLEFRRRRFENEPSVCGAISFKFPVLSFQAEVVSMKDGRILARLDEQRSPRPAVPLRRQIQASQWKPLHETGYTVYEGSAPVDGKYTFVAGWTEENTLCANAVREYEAIYEGVARTFRDFVRTSADELFRSTLDPLYGLSSAQGMPLTSPPLPEPARPAPPAVPPPIAAPVEAAKPQPGCTSDADCKGNRVCRGGRCVQP